jgi:hypothetical protein
VPREPDGREYHGPSGYGPSDPGGGRCVLAESFDELRLAAGPATARCGSAAFAARHEGGPTPHFRGKCHTGCHRWGIVWPGPEHTAVLP